MQGNNYRNGRRDGYDEFNNYQQNQYRQQQQQQRHQQQQRGYSHQEIAAAMMNEDLLPVDAGFVIPSLGGGHQQGQYSQNRSQNQQQQYSQNQQQYQQCYPVNDDNYVPSSDEVFNGQQFNPVYSCDKTVSTMSSFDVQSMDMSSLGGFSFTNHSLAQSHNQNLNMSAMSGLISTGSALSRSGTSMARKKQTKSSLERKLEKVNEAHRRQQMEEMEKRRIQAMRAQGDQGQGSALCFEVPTKKSSGVPKNNKGMMNSLTSFGFEDIAEEEQYEEASVKMSNLGLSEMEMTFNSDVFSVKSKVDKIRDRESSPEDKPAKRKSSTGSDERKRSPPSDVPAKLDNRVATSASSVFGSSIGSEITGSNRGSMSSMGSKQFPAKFDLDNFNESLRSMDLEDRAPMAPDPPSNAPEGRNMNDKTRPLMGNASAPRRRQREPTGGSLPSLAAGGTHVERGGHAAERAAPAHNGFDISDPNVTAEDFGISFNSIRSFASQDSDTSSWLDQYQSMENVMGGKNPWDEEGSHSSSLSEISAPRMGVAI